MLGPHLTLDLYSCDKEKLLDVEFIAKILNELPDLIGMHKISKPMVVPYPGREDSFDKGGISAVILIAESHISIHTWIAQEYASVDIFSCKPFNIEATKRYFVEKLGAKKVECNITTRGREFPKDIEKAIAIVAKSRKKVSK